VPGTGRALVPERVDQAVQQLGTAVEVAHLLVDGQEGIAFRLVEQAGHLGDQDRIVVRRHGQVLLPVEVAPTTAVVSAARAGRRAGYPKRSSSMPVTVTGTPA
jgi:hypothetical protein